MFSSRFFLHTGTVVLSEAKHRGLLRWMNLHSWSAILRFTQDDKIRFPPCTLRSLCDVRSA